MTSEGAEPSVRPPPPRPRAAVMQAPWVPGYVPSAAATIEQQAGSVAPDLGRWEDDGGPGVGEPASEGATCGRRRARPGPRASWRNPRGTVPTDLKILQTLQEWGPAPVPVFLLAERSGLPVDRMTLRMKSLVSLRYVERLAVAEAESYALAPAATCPSLAPPHLMTGAPVQPNGRRRVERVARGPTSYRTRTNVSNSGA